MSPLVQQIRNRLAELAPLALEVVDDSAKHAGHAGARGGAGHFDVTVVSERFNGLSQVARHRLVYGLLADLIPQKIHALAIRALAPASPPSAAGHNASQP
jgi:BolA family transcriptional regulator, general stress-responsive regulator